MRALRGLTLGLLLAVGGGGLPAVAAEDGTADFVDPRVLDLDPPDTRVGHPARVTVSGRLHEGYGAPAVVVIRPDGRAVEVPLKEWAAPVFRAEVALGDGRGVYRFEVRATTRRDLTHSGARWRVFAGVPSDTPDEPEPPDDPTPEDVPPALLEARFFALVNEHRRRARLEPFAWLEPLGAVARTHAEAALKAGRLDHRVDGGGNLAQRLMRAMSWGDFVYSLPPGRPSPAPGAKNYAAAATDSRKSLPLILYRWQRFAAFCLPMTSEYPTHAACGIARAKDGTLYLVFAYAQLNAPSVLEDVASYPARLARDVRSLRGAEKAERLREWGRWRVPAARVEARRLLADPDPDVRAAAHDVLLLLDEEAGRAKVAEAARALDEALADPAEAEAAGRLAAWLSRLRNAPVAARAATEALRALDGGAGQGASPPGR